MNPKVQKRLPCVARKPGEVNTREAADLLECSYQTLRTYVSKGLLGTPRTPLGKGIGKPVLLKRKKVLELRDKLRSGAN